MKIKKLKSKTNYYFILCISIIIISIIIFMCHFNCLLEFSFGQNKNPHHEIL